MHLSQKPRVIFDTNVVISGILFGGTPKQILDLWKQEKVAFCISPQLKIEILSKMANKFHFSESRLVKLDHQLEKRTEKFLPKRKTERSRDPNDNFLLDLAMESQADFLITGDKDLLILKKVGTTHIIRPVDFVTLFS